MTGDFRGPCANDPEMWFSHDAEEIAHAKAICSRCPMRDACLQAALDFGDKEGVWGGLTPDERGRLVRKRQRKSRAKVAS